MWRFIVNAVVVYDYRVIYIQVASDVRPFSVFSGETRAVVSPNQTRRPRSIHFTINIYMSKVRSERLEPAQTAFCKIYLTTTWEQADDNSRHPFLEG